MNHWVETAIQLLTKSLQPVPQELNEIDWKSGLSDKSERLAQPVGMDHTVADYKGNAVLFIHIPEHTDKPVHLRGIRPGKCF
jgi:hypothetical protein